MRILFLIQRPQRRGAETFALQLSRHLNAMGHTVKVVALFRGPADFTTTVEYIALNRPASRRFFDIAGFNQLAEIIQKENIEFVQANAGDTLKYATLSKVLFGWKANIVFRNASTVSQYIRNPVVKVFNRWLYNHVDHIISVAEFTKLDLVKLFPAMSNRITVIPVGVEFKDQFGPEDKTYDIIHVGGFSFEKNHSGLLSIYQRIKRKLPDVKLLLIGDGPLRQNIEAMAIGSREKESITFAGSIADSLPYIRAAKVVVLPSIIEGVPAVILEAFMCKVPVVAYNVGGIPEIILDHKTGRLISVNDEEGFSDAVIEIIQHSERYEPIIEKAYSYVRDNFDNREIARRFENVYKGLLSM